tara:strand:- start:1086 stop:1418 length:333 start_codon:yes stop_codon:yes gene_type:complete
MSIANLYIDQGADYSTVVTIKDSAGDVLDLTAYTATAQIRKTYSSSTAVSFTCTFNAVRTTGKITLSLTDTQTSAMNSGLYRYDLLIVDATGLKTRAVEGTADISAMVTQ